MLRKRENEEDIFNYQFFHNITITSRFNKNDLESFLEYLDKENFTLTVNYQEQFLGKIINNVEYKVWMNENVMYKETCSKQVDSKDEKVITKVYSEKEKEKYYDVITSGEFAQSLKNLPKDTLTIATEKFQNIPTREIARQFSISEEDVLRKTSTVLKIIKNKIEEPLNKNDCKVKIYKK